MSPICKRLSHIGTYSGIFNRVATGEGRVEEFAACNQYAIQAGLFSEAIRSGQRSKQFFSAGEQEHSMSG